MSPAIPLALTALIALSACKQAAQKVVQEGPHVVRTVTKTSKPATTGAVVAAGTQRGEGKLGAGMKKAADEGGHVVVHHGREAVHAAEAHHRSKGDRED
jgi:hypothetical protein